MRDLPGQNKLLLEAFQDRSGIGQFRLNDLNRYPSVQFVILRLVHRSHGALAEDLQNFVTTTGEFCAALHDRNRRAACERRLVERGERFRCAADRW